MAQVPPLSAISAPIEKARKRPGPVKEFFSKLGWYAGCVITLGYAPKYYRKILKWQVYDLSKKNKDRPAYLEDFNSKALGLETSVRAKQQREWDRLIMPLSVITATSAAALAIPSPFGTPNIFWLATAFYSVAFGLSLEGLIIITYLTVFGAGSSAETIGRIASGKAFLHGMVGPVAIVTALPTAITTYSSFFLLAGLLAMTIAADSRSSIKDHMGAFQAIVLVPVCVMLLWLVLTIAGCEVFAWIEARAREKREKRKNEEKRDGQARADTNEDQDLSKAEEGSRVASRASYPAQGEQA